MDPVTPKTANRAIAALMPTPFSPSTCCIVTGWSVMLVPATLRPVAPPS